MIKIEDYRNQEIFYDEDSDKFVCNMVVEDKSKGTKRSSLKDVRREIDQFIKLNADFKPIRVLRMSMWSDSVSEETFSAIRKDGCFVLRKPNSNRLEYAKKRDLEEFYEYDEKIVELQKERDRLSDEFDKKDKAILEDIKKRLRPIGDELYNRYFSDKD